MNMEQKLKALLGELMFQIASLQLQAELLQKENDELKKAKDKDVPKDTPSPEAPPRFARRHD